MAAITESTATKMDISAGRILAEAFEVDPVDATTGSVTVGEWTVVLGAWAQVKESRDDAPSPIVAAAVNSGTTNQIDLTWCTQAGVPVQGNTANMSPVYLLAIGY